MLQGMVWRGIAWYMAWQCMAYGLVYGIAWRAWHGIGYGIVGMAWYMVRPGGHSIWYIVWPGMHGMLYGMVWRAYRSI